MFAKLTRLAVVSTAVVAAAGVVRAQQDAPPRAPWPFGNSLSNIFGTSGNGSNGNGTSGNGSNGNSSMQPNGGMTSAQPAPNNANANNSLGHSVTSQSESNRRLYGPSLAIRGGVADGYSPPNNPAGRPSARRVPDEMQPVISQGTPATDGSADAVTSNVGQYPMPNNASQYPAPSYSTSTRDSRPLAERLKSMRQGSDGDSAQPMAVAESAPPPSTPSRTGPSSRRAAQKVEIVDEDHAPHLAPADIDVRAPLAKRQSIPATADAGTPRIAKKETAAAEQPESLPRPSSRVPAIEKSAPEIGSPNGSGGLPRQSPLVSVETTGPRTIVIGREATYMVTIKNTGDAAAQDVAAAIKIPEWTDVVSAEATAGATKVAGDANEPFQWKIPRLESHSKETLTLRLLPRKGRGFDLAVQWTFSPLATQTMVDVQEPKLTLAISGPEEVTYGQSKLYRLTIANPGSGDAENVIIKLDPIGNSTAAPTKHPIGTIKAGENKVVELELTARQMGTVSIHASATAEPGLKADAAEDVVVRRAAVALQVEGTKCKYAGTAGTYTIHVANSGNATAENVHVVATLPAGAKFVAASAGGQWKADQGKVGWVLPPLRPGGDASLDLKCVLMTPGANRLQVASSAAGDVSDAATVTTNVEALADLKLDVVEPAGPIAVGDEVVYELHVRNRGSKAAEGVGVITYFSEGIEPVSAQGGKHDISNGVVAFHPLASLAAGGELTLKVKARADKGGKQVFRAEVECGALGTKLVSAQEMMVFGGDDAPGLEHADHAIAGRNPPLRSLPAESDQEPKPLRK